MRPHPGTRKAAKWTALVLGILLLAAGAAGTVWSVRGFRYTFFNEFRVGLEAGGMSYHSSPYFSYPPTLYEWTWHVYRAPDASLRWSPTYSSRNMAISGSAFIYEVFLPLWIPTLLSLTLSAALFRYDTIATRRANRGLCPACSYDRTGLAPSSPCPECGKAV